MYADLVGSTKTKMTLPIDKMVTIVRGFSYEMSYIIHRYKGYALKYVGNAVIAFFPSIYNKSLACNKAVECAKSMITIIKEGFNPVLNQHNYPELQVKIGIGEGESIIIQYGHDGKISYRYSWLFNEYIRKNNFITYPNTITIGENIYNDLYSNMKVEFKEIKLDSEHWKYVNKRTGQLYKLYANIDRQNITY